MVLCVCAGVSDCVLALGFEKMERGSLTPKVRESKQLPWQHHSTMSLFCLKNGPPLPPSLLTGLTRWTTTWK